VKPERVSEQLIVAPGAPTVRTSGELATLRPGTDERSDPSHRRGRPPVQLRLVAGPEVLARHVGYTLWHAGIVNGPHGLALTIEVLDESGSRRMAGQRWQSSSLNRGPVEVSAVTVGDVTRPCETIEARSPDYYRLICMFGKYGRTLGPRAGAEGLHLDVTVHPLGLHVMRAIA
jgi:hypothetical protein